MMSSALFFGSTSNSFYISWSACSLQMVAICARYEIGPDENIKSRVRTLISTILQVSRPVPESQTITLFWRSFKSESRAERSIQAAPTCQLVALFAMRIHLHLFFSLEQRRKYLYNRVWVIQPEYLWHIAFDASHGCSIDGPIFESYRRSAIVLTTTSCSWKGISSCSAEWLSGKMIVITGAGSSAYRGPGWAR